MQGTVLILDGIATNRIMLKVQLSASYYHVVQADRMAHVIANARQYRPDLIVTAMTLPDGDALALRDLLAREDDLSDIPVLAITAENDAAARLTALRGGLDDVLSRPVDDAILLARVRSLIRSRANAEDLGLRADAPHALGFAEPAAQFAPPARVALVARNGVTAGRWQRQLAQWAGGHRLLPHCMSDIPALMAGPVPDAFVVEIAANAEGEGLRFIADLRARSLARNAVVFAVIAPPDAARAADLLDRGADDVLGTGFDPEELALRLNAHLARKSKLARLRSRVRDGLRAAIIDPMTGLYNRRYAMPHLAQVARQSEAAGTQFAVLMADLDHFKQINDSYGHPSGDAVLVETAARLRHHLRPADEISRIGGEEFMIVLPDTDEIAATRMAENLCRQIQCKPYWVPQVDQPINVTISIGVAMGPLRGAPQGTDLGEDCTDRLIRRADRALFDAKHGGRNKVRMTRSAA